jgi:membrane protein implicated in regulation of membrane protease activity
MADLTAFLLGHPMWAWFAIGAVFLIVEVITGSGWLLWPAGSAGVVGLLLFFAPLGTAVQAVLFAVLTIVTTYVGRRYLHTVHAPGGDVNDPHARLIGHRGEAVETFKPGAGRVFVDGKEWSAELEGDGALVAGAPVVVTALLGGARLRVRLA